MLIKLAANIPTLILNPNPWRVRFTIQMQAELVDANNTGKVFIGIGRQPVPTVGHAGQGEVLIQSAAIERPEKNRPLEKFEKAAIWATSDSANQTIVVEEIIKKPEVAKE